MKAKLSVTLDESLVTFVDDQPGTSRSEKLEAIVKRFRDVQRELDLRRQLAALEESADDRREADAWQRAMEEAQWRESDAATSGPSPSRPSRSRGRR